MSTKSVIVAVMLIALGIVFGVTLVSSFKGVDASFAGENVQLGSQTTQTKSSSSLHALNDAYRSVAKEIIPAVVYIKVTTKPRSSSRQNDQFFFRFFGPDFQPQEPHGEMGAGSGVILTPDGYILTNNHVVDNADPDKIEVVLSDTRRFKATKVVGTDRYTDLAVIKIDAEELPIPRLGDSDGVEVGHIVFAFGNPLGLTSTMTQGIVSAIGRNIGIIDNDDGYGIENFIQTDAAVNPGNSGGALVNVDGEVVGVNTAIATTNQRYQGYSFAIPINLAKKVAGDIIKYGKVLRGYLGVEISSIDATMAKAQGLSRAQGVLVNSVRPDGAAQDAGLKANDIILSVDGKEVNTANQLQTVIAAKHPGDVVTLKLLRDKKPLEKKVTLRARSEEDTVVPAVDREDTGSKPEKAEPATVELEKIGLTVRNIDAEIRKQYEVDNGVFVEKVEQFSEAAQRAVFRGDVILTAGDVQVNSAKQFEEIIRSKKPGDAVLLRVKRASKQTQFVAIEIPK
ncbi:MAG: Do family serine endopeptidase [Ignavibacteriae bacterium]|nr:Do family serine endopeptidase [Ignavibacteriota bacterium]